MRAALVAPDQPLATFRALGRAMGHRLFTITQHDRAAGFNTRIPGRRQ